MRILHVSAGLQETCGVSCFVVESARAQMALGHEVCIVTTMTCGYPTEDLDIRLLQDPTQVDFVPDIVHLHSTWNMYVHKMARWCRRHHYPYVISPHGALTPWALKYRWWKKLPALLLYQYADFRHADGFHVTVPTEAGDLRRLRLKQPVTIAPLGVHVPHSTDIDTTSAPHDLLFLSRIHPVKGLIMLFHVWHDLVSVQYQSWRLIIAGPDDVGHQQELKQVANQLGLSVSDFSQSFEFGKKQIEGGGEVPVEAIREKLSGCQSDVIFTGPVYAEAKTFLYQSARLFVLPSFSENFGMVILEALAAGTPVITTTGTPWESLPKAHCGWWVAPHEAELKEALESAMKLSPEAYQSMSQSAVSFVRSNYSWESTAQSLLDSYQSILTSKHH